MWIRGGWVRAVDLRGKNECCGTGRRGEAVDQRGIDG